MVGTGSAHVESKKASVRKKTFKISLQQLLLAKKSFLVNVLPVPDGGMWVGISLPGAYNAIGARNRDLVVDAGRLR